MPTQPPKRTSRDAPDVQRFVARLLADLPTPAAGTAHALPAHTRHYRAKTIHAECGVRKMHAPFFEVLTARLTDAGIHTDRSLTAPGLQPGDWVRFSRVPFAVTGVAFPREHLLQQFLLGAIGTFGPLKDLRLIGEQYRLSTGRRIDLLCEEARRDRRGALVAVELKRTTDQRTVEQVVRYLRDLEREDIATGRAGVRGMVISGSDDDIGIDLAKHNRDFDIQWFRYAVSLERIE